MSRESGQEAWNAEAKRKEHHEGADERCDQRHDEDRAGAGKAAHAPLERLHIGGAGKPAEARQGVLEGRFEAQEKRLAAREFLLDAGKLLLDARKLVEPATAAGEP